LMNNKVGLNAIVSTKNAIRSLALMLACPDQLTKNMVFQLLLVVLLYSEDGYKLLLDALTAYAAENKEKRFHILIKSLKESKSVDQQLIIMSLIENITSKPHELDFRVALHSELFRLGLQELVDEIKKTPAYDTNLGDIIDNFEEDVKGDREDLEKKFQGLEIDFTSVDKIAEALKERIEPTPAFHSLLAILRDLVLLPGDTDAGLKAWILIERLVMQVSIQKQALVLDEQSVKLDDLFASVAVEAEAAVNQQQLSDLTTTNQKLERNIQQKDVEIREMTLTCAELKQRLQDKQKQFEEILSKTKDEDSANKLKLSDEQVAAIKAQLQSSEEERKKIKKKT